MNIPYFCKIYEFPPISVQFTAFLSNLRFLLPPILTMMHLCITLYTYWTPLGWGRPILCLSQHLMLIFRWRGPSSMVKLDGEAWPDLLPHPMDPPLTRQQREESTASPQKAHTTPSILSKTSDFMTPMQRLQYSGSIKIHGTFI